MMDRQQRADLDRYITRSDDVEERVPMDYRADLADIITRHQIRLVKALARRPLMERQHQYDEGITLAHRAASVYLREQWRSHGLTLTQRLQATL